MADLTGLIDWLGEDRSLALGGLLIGAFFGVLAQRSRFCLRAAVVEVARGQLGAKLSIWLLAFSAAIIVTQFLHLSGHFDTANVRQLSSQGSLSGALVGGLMFGTGMILARGCSSRLLVLAANGNLRALLSGLIFAVTAQASMTGILSPAREAIGAWWTIDGGNARDLLAIFGIGHGGGLAFGLLWLAAGAWFATRQRINAWGWIGGLGAGVMVAMARDGLNGIEREEAIANARLIASAPDLLAALEWAMGDIDSEILGEEWAERATAAIAKAKGDE